MTRRRWLLPLLLVLCALGLTACRGGAPAERRVLVSLIETDAFTVENNGLWVYPGKNAGFTLRMKGGMELVGADYDGTVRIWQENGVTHLTLENVRCPQRVRLTVTSHYRKITYHANGGAPLTEGGETVTVTSNVQTHLRPNTRQGIDLFSRDGYTLSCWNTAPDGSGARVGLGSRVTVPEEGLNLYAQWEKWADEAFFLYTGGGEITLTGWEGAADTLVIPAYIQGRPVTRIAAGAFADAAVRNVILPVTLDTVEPGAFTGCALESLTFFDNIQEISDAAFADCRNFSTLYINAAEAPYGYAYRRESVLADKADLLILNQGVKKAVFYAGCSMWYNLNGQQADFALGGEYAVINMAINGTCSSLAQMEIIAAYLEPGDLFFHTPEICAPAQLLTRTAMDKRDDKLWCGLENNYDLFSLVDIRGFDGALDSLCLYLAMKTEEAAYWQTYVDDDGHVYVDEYGCVPFERTVSEVKPADRVYLDPEELASADLTALAAQYRQYLNQGVRVYVSWACMDLDALEDPAQRDLVGDVDRVFRQRFTEMDGPAVISTLWDYLYTDADCYDTAYHLLSAAAARNTACWMRDLTRQMQKEEAGL